MLHRDAQSSPVFSPKHAFRYSTLAERRAAVRELSSIDRKARLKLLLLGKPSSGKGTIAPLISQRHRAVHISVGDLLRAEIRSGTELGAVAKSYMQKGALLPSDLILRLIKVSDAPLLYMRLCPCVLRMGEPSG